MHYKTNRLNHDFRIIYFLAGSCHTPDAAYGLLCDLREDRTNAINNYKAEKIREKAKILRAKRRMESDDEAERLEGEADIAAIVSTAECGLRNYEAALAELATIEKLMAHLEPHRKYAHLSQPEAHEAAQEEEWKLELIHRAENSLLTTGSIPPDHFATMRLHPAFATELLPAISEMRRLMTMPDGQLKMLQRKSGTSELLKLLEEPPKPKLKSS